VVPSWNQRQFAQNVREGNKVHHILWRWQVQDLGSNLGSAGPPPFRQHQIRLSLAIIVQGLDKRSLALLGATSVGADPHLENQINASIPALVDATLMAELNAASDPRMDLDSEVEAE
jgi:hypothetical protein